VGTRLFVGSLPFEYTNEQLRELFSAVGAVTEATMVWDKKHGRTRGFGFVTMATEALASDAIAQLNGRAVGARSIWVTEARPSERASAPASARPRSEHRPAWRTTPQGADRWPGTSSFFPRRPAARNAEGPRRRFPQGPRFHEPRQGGQEWRRRGSFRAPAAPSFGPYAPATGRQAASFPPQGRRRPPNRRGARSMPGAPNAFFDSRSFGARWPARSEPRRPFTGPASSPTFRSRRTRGAPQRAGRRSLRSPRP
jgi:RNA recognition motif-containing protein